MGHNHHAIMSSTKHNIRSNWVRRYILSWHASFLTEADVSSTTSSKTNDNSSGHTQSAHAHFPQLHGLRHLKQDLPVSPQHPNTNTPRLPSPSRTHLRYLPFPLPPKTANPSPMPLLRPPHSATERTFPTQHRQRWNLVCLTECIHWQLCLWTQKPCGQTDIKGICQAVCNSEYQLGEVCSIMESGRWYILQEHASFVPGPCPLMQQMYNVGWTPVTHLRAIQPCTTTCSSW